MIGRTIGSYTILAKLGEGGMGAVWRGVDTMLDRPVAIKVLRPELASDAEVVERFRAEAVTLAKLSHPSIASVYAFIREGSELFLVMEFVEGETLDAVLRRDGQFPWPRATRLACTALDAIDAAHAAGVIHRDLKPENIMITRTGGLKIMDFGIARVVGTTRLTRAGHLVGTLHYMSPDQIRGVEPDARSDIYSMGVVLFEMVTGKLPFNSTSEYSLMKAHLEDPPPPPRGFVPDLPDGLNDAILRALAKEADDRWPSAADFRAVLEAYAEAEPTSPRFTPLPGIIPSEHRTTPARARHTSMPTALTPAPHGIPVDPTGASQPTRRSDAAVPIPVSSLARGGAPQPPTGGSAFAARAREIAGVAATGLGNVVARLRALLASLPSGQLVILGGAAVLAVGILTVALAVRGCRSPGTGTVVAEGVPTPVHLESLELQLPTVPAEVAVESAASATPEPTTPTPAPQPGASAPPRAAAPPRRRTATPVPTATATEVPPTPTEPPPSPTAAPAAPPDLHATLEAFGAVETATDEVTRLVREHLRAKERWRPAGQDANLWELLDGLQSATNKLNFYLKKTYTFSKFRKGDWTDEQLAEVRSRLADLSGRLPAIDEAMGKVEMSTAARSAWDDLKGRIHRLRARF